MKIVNYKCDVCLEECREKDETTMEVIFTTSQTDGMSQKPRLTRETLFVCGKCMDEVLKGNYIFGAGAQGYNRYWMKGGQDESDD